MRIWKSLFRFLSLSWLYAVLIAFAWPTDAQEVTIPLWAAYYTYSDTGAIHNVDRANVRDSMGAEIKPFASISYALPKQPMTELDGMTSISADGYYHDSIGVWMSCPAGYTITVATSWDGYDHFEVGSFTGPLAYGLYWSPFHSSPYIDREYGGVIYATVEVHQTHGHIGRYYSASIDAALLKCWKGSLAVSEQRDTTSLYQWAGRHYHWYTFPLIGDTHFEGTESEARQSLPPGMYVSPAGKFAIGR